MSMPPDFGARTEAELADLDGVLAARESRWWDSFYADRARPCAFFGRSADESLAGWVRDGVIRPGRAIEFGCGNGRNAVFLARHGFTVEAVDYAESAIAWARDRVAEAGVSVSLTCRSVFDLPLQAGAFDLVYDSGCFHHIPPHRRDRYVDRVVEALKPGGWFGLTCFRPEGGSGYADHEVYERRSMGGGLGYTEERLREIWSRSLEVRIVRRMDETAPERGLFGHGFLWTLLARRT